MPRLVFGSVAVDGATHGVADVVGVASDVAIDEAATSASLVVAASLAFSSSNLACMTFPFARAERTIITWQPLSMLALQIGSTTE